MACIPPTSHPPPLADAIPAKPTARPLGFYAPSPPTLKRSSASSRSIPCRCRLNNSGAASSPDGDSGRRGWDSLLNDAVRSAVKRWDDYFASYRNPRSKAPPLADDWAEEVDGEAVGETADAADWDWDRWKRHFADVEEEERIVAVLKAQLRDAVAREDYKEAAKLKLAIITTSEKDAVGTAISNLNRAVAKEHFKDAAFFRDHAGTGMVGWWAGIAEDATDPYGRIIRISAEHGKYVARSYSSRQLATGRAGVPLFEIFFTENEGEYKRQAVYLRWSSVNSGDFQTKYAKMSDSSSLKPPDRSAEGQKDSYSDDIQSAEERDDDSDVDDGVAGIQNILRDMIPGVKVKVLKVVSPGKVDKDLIAKVVEQIMDEEDEGANEDVENIEAVDSNSESDIDEIEMDVGDATGGAIPEPNEAPVKFVIGTLMQKLSSDVLPKQKVRVPARIESRDRLSFSFFIEQDDGQHKTDEKENGLHKKVAAYSAKQSADLVMSDLAKVFLSKEKIPMKVLRDVGQLITSAINQNQNHQTLSGKTFFNRIEIPTTSDPLSGLYVGAHGMHTSEILHLKRKFGQWQLDDIGEKHKDLEFYEYVEALKLTGGLSVPAGQVVFRAKVGKHYQLPHKGIIPEEFGVVARYKGQGRIADPGFQNPRWVDGELVILDGKYIRGGPVIGFVYWAPEYHFLVFFNRLKLPD